MREPASPATMERRRVSLGVVGLTVTSSSQRQISHLLDVSTEGENDGETNLV